MAKKKNLEKKSVNGKLIVDSIYGSESEKIEIRDFADVELANVSYTLGFTYNIGNYESVRVGVSVTLPCYVEELEQAYRKAREFVEMKLAEIDKEIKEIIEKRKEVF